MAEFFDDITRKRDRRSEALPGDQARPDDDDAFDEDSGKTEDDFTADGEVRYNPCKN